MRVNSKGRTPLSPGQVEGLGHPNVTLEKDYRGINGWCIRVDTIVPIKNEAQIRKWLDNPPTNLRALAESVIDQTPDGGDQFGARHMVAAALGFELAENGTSVDRPRPPAPKVKPTEKEVRPPS